MTCRLWLGTRGSLLNQPITAGLIYTDKNMEIIISLQFVGKGYNNKNILSRKGAKAQRKD